MLLLASSVCALFKWRQFEPEVILLGAGWYLRFSLSCRDVEELLAGSETVMANQTMRRLRTFAYEGEQVEMFRHLKIGIEAYVAKTIRVHFHWNSERENPGPHR
jgi:hypothetical protein